MTNRKNHSLTYLLLFQRPNYKGQINGRWMRYICLLQENGIVTFQDAINAGDCKMIRIRGFGRCGLNFIKEGVLSFTGETVGK